MKLKYADNKFEFKLYFGFELEFEAHKEKFEFGSSSIREKKPG